jgi:hypothetical protein
MHLITRRRFIQSGASASLVAAGLPLLGADEKKPAPNERLHVGVIGVAGRGEGNWQDLKKAGAEEQFKAFKPPEPTIANSIGHHKEWIEACKSGGSTTCNFDYAGALTECVLLGTVSYRSGKSFEWDAVKLKAKGEPEADKFVSKEYRKGWEVT